MKKKSLDNLSIKELKRGLRETINKINKNSIDTLIDDTCFEIYKQLLQKKNGWDIGYERLYQKAKRGALDY